MGTANDDDDDTLLLVPPQQQHVGSLRFEHYEYDVAQQQHQPQQQQQHQQQYQHQHQQCQQHPSQPGFEQQQQQQQPQHQNTYDSYLPHDNSWGQPNTSSQNGTTSFFGDVPPYNVNNGVNDNVSPDEQNRHHSSELDVANDTNGNGGDASTHPVDDDAATADVDADSGAGDTKGLKILKILMWPYLKWPSVIIVIVLALSGVLIQRDIKLALDGQISLDISATSFQIKKHPASEQADGYSAAKQHCSDRACATRCGGHGSVADLATEMLAREQIATEGLATEETEPKLERGRRSGSSEIKFYYASDTNILTQSNLLYARAIEHDFARYTQSQPSSIIFQSTGCAPNDVLCEIHQYQPYRWVGGDNVNVSGSVWEAQVLLSLFSSIPEYMTDEQLASRLNGYNANKAEYCYNGCVLSEVDAIFVYRADSLYDYTLMGYVEHDLMFCAYAGAVVAAYLFIHTMSVWLTLVGVFNIVLSFPLAYFFYRDCLGNVQALPLLAIASIFITIGIAVDDVFVFIDTFKQTNTALSLSARMIHTFSRAGKATLFTSLTSAVAFASNALSEIPALHDFGVFTALVVVANYILVLTLTLAGISFWHRWVLPLENRVVHLICPWRKQLMTGGSPRSWRRLSHSQVYENAAFDDGRNMINSTSVEPTDADDVPMIDYSDVSPLANDDHTSDTNGHSRQTYEGNLSFMQLILANVVVPFVRRGRVVLIIVIFVLVGVGAWLASTIPISSEVPSFAPRGSNLALAQTLASKFPGDAGYTPPKVNTRSPTLRPQTPPPSSPTLPPTPHPTTATLSTTSVWQTSSSQSTIFTTPKQDGSTTRPTIPLQSSSTSRSTPQSSYRPTSRPTSRPTLRPTTPRPTPSPPPQSRSPTKAWRPSPHPVQPPQQSYPTPALQTAAPRTVNDYPNEKVQLVFGIGAPYVDRVGLSTATMSTNTTLWRPHFDPNFHVPFPCSASSVALLSIQQICVDLSNDADLLLQVGDQADMCSHENIQNACMGNPSSHFRVGFRSECYNSEFSWISIGDFISTEPDDASPFEVYAFWQKWDKKMKALVKKYPQVSSAFAVGTGWSASVYTVLAVKGSIWSIVASYVLSFAAVCIFMMEMRSITITMLSILVNVVLVVGGFHVLGWSLGAIEAVSFSILVGTSVDYFLHMLEGYKHSSDECDTTTTKSELRIWSTSKTITTVGVPIFSSALTTAGCAFMLCFTTIQPLKRFGQIIVLNTCISTLLTFFFAAPMLMVMGPQKFSITWKRCVKTLVVLVIFGVGVYGALAATGMTSQFNPDST